MTMRHYFIRRANVDFIVHVKDMLVSSVSMHSEMLEGKDELVFVFGFTI